MQVITEVNGYKFGLNDEPDVVAALPEEKRYMIEEPDGETFVGNRKGIARMFNKLTGSNISEQ